MLAAKRAFAACGKLTSNPNEPSRGAKECTICHTEFYREVSIHRHYDDNGEALAVRLSDEQPVGHECDASRVSSYKHYAGRQLG